MYNELSASTRTALNSVPTRSVTADRDDQPLSLIDWLKSTPDDTVEMLRFRPTDAEPGTFETGRLGSTPAGTAEILSFEIQQQTHQARYLLGCL